MAGSAELNANSTELDTGGTSQSDSSQAITVLSACHSADSVSISAAARAFSIAFRFATKSTAAYRFVVSRLACPSEWLIVTMSIPLWSR